jgi:hypothetical protein
MDSMREDKRRSNYFSTLSLFSSPNPPKKNHNVLEKKWISIYIGRVILEYI